MRDAHRRNPQAKVVITGCYVELDGEEIRNLASRIAYGYRKDFLRKYTEILIEEKRDGATGLLTGHDDKYIKILIQGEDLWKRKIATARIQKVEPERTFGAILQN